MKKLILLSILLTFGCEEVLEPEDCAGVEGGDSILDSCGVCGGDDSSCYGTFENLSWGAFKFDVEGDWNPELDEYTWSYSARCFYIADTNKCESLEEFLALNDYVKDTIYYHKWTEIRLPYSQIGLENVTIELIGNSGLVNPYSDIEYYEYLND